MSNGTIERTALAGGDGDDGPYIRQGIEAIEAVLKMQMQVGPGEFYVEPIAFAPDSTHWALSRSSGVILSAFTPAGCCCTAATLFRIHRT